MAAGGKDRFVVFLLGTLGVVGVGWAACALQKRPTPGPAIATGAASASASVERPLGVLPVLKGARWSARLVVQRLRATAELTAPLLTTAPFEGLFEDFRVACGVAALEVVDDAAVSGAEDSVAVLRMASERRDALVACAAAHGGELVVNGQKTTQLTSSGLVVATKDDLLLIGGRPAVAAILRGDTEPAPSPADDVLVTFASGATASIQRWDASVRRGPLRAESRVVTSDPWLLANLERALADAGLDGLTSHEVKGSEWIVGWSAVQPPRAVAAFGMLGASLYLSAEKAAVARATVAELGARLAKTAEKAGKCPPSAPKVPAAVPRGTLVLVGADSFVGPTWTMVGPPSVAKTHYQYAIDTDADGRRCTVSAVGDLDADGVDARFSIEVVVEGGKATQKPLVVAQELE